MNMTESLPERVKDLVENFDLREGGELDTPPESLLHTGFAITAGVATRKCLQSAWKRWRGSDPPDNPAQPGVTWTDALIWAAAVGATVGVARVLSRRSTTAAVRRIRS